MKSDTQPRLLLALAAVLFSMAAASLLGRYVIDASRDCVEDTNTNVCEVADEIQFAYNQGFLLLAVVLAVGAVASLVAWLMTLESAERVMRGR